MMDAATTEKIAAERLAACGWVVSGGCAAVGLMEEYAIGFSVAAYCVLCVQHIHPPPLSKLHNLPNKRLTPYGKVKILKTKGLFFKILKINELVIVCERKGTIRMRVNSVSLCFYYIGGVKR